MAFRRRQIGLPLMLSASQAACGIPVTPPPEMAAVGTPAARVAAESFAAVIDPSGGPPIGAAVAIAPLRAITNGHVARAVGEGGYVRLQRGDGVTEAGAAVLAVSDRIDLAVLGLPHGFLAPASAAKVLPVPGDFVWAVGPHRLGRALATGRVMHAARSVSMPANGFIAQLPALLGYSGGPVVDRAGGLLGITTATLSEPLGAYLLALLTGADLAGLAFGEERRVFVLGIGPALAEAQSISD